MRRNFTKGLLMGGLALAGLASAGQVAQATAPNTSTTVEYKATEKKKPGKQKIAINPMTGGLDFNHGGSKRSNRNRYSHNAKVKRRRAY